MFIIKLIYFYRRDFKCSYKVTPQLARIHFYSSGYEGAVEVNTLTASTTQIHIKNHEEVGMSQPLFSCRSERIRLLAFRKWNFWGNKSIVVRCNKFEAKSKWRVNQYGRTFGVIAQNGHNKRIENISIRQT